MRLGVDVKQALHMKQGSGDTSYTNASYIQKEVLLMTKSIKEEAMMRIFDKAYPHTISIADLGCSSSVLNTLGVISDLIAVVEKARQKLRHGPIDYQVYLNDLPGNDFNTVFKSVTNFQDNLKQQMGEGFGNCFVNGVPGSFYGRLFPANSLHFVHSSYSLMWLSQAPNGIEDNKENICIAKTSPAKVIKAYSKQFEKDFSMFLSCRSKEVVSGGKMVLTILGRKSIEPYSKESCLMWEILATILNDMVFEGILNEEKLNSFNIPNYFPSASEVKLLVEQEGSFALNSVNVFEVNWDRNNNSTNSYDFAKCMRSVAEPLLISHFGQAIVIDEVFQRYEELVHKSMAKEKNVFINVTISMTRKNEYVNGTPDDHACS